MKIGDLGSTFQLKAAKVNGPRIVEEGSPTSGNTRQRTPVRDHVAASRLANRDASLDQKLEDSCTDLDLLFNRLDARLYIETQSVNQLLAQKENQRRLREHQRSEEMLYGEIDIPA